MKQVGCKAVDERQLKSIALVKLREAVVKGTSGRWRQRRMKYSSSIKYGFLSQSGYRLDT
ncbi:hypothetical protein [Pontibacter kalidii]|uniref:hypothetical protein n=1 Tax=Pontibacter kalidii TaxID=2592049 RepID=UPI0022519FAD|nr:hypothetical protein [Pontibacter kalidii]